jgi:uncharacterized membrane protein YccF (DUF307 family)
MTGFHSLDTVYLICGTFFVKELYKSMKKILSAIIIMMLLVSCAAHDGPKITQSPPEISQEETMNENGISDAEWDALVKENERKQAKQDLKSAGGAVVDFMFWILPGMWMEFPQ